MKTFEIDHTKLMAGLYINNIDYYSDSALITLDLRIVKPYHKRVLFNEELHTIEHVYAFAFREAAKMAKNKLDVVYFGPMGCQTGFYLVLRHDGRLPDTKFLAVRRIFSLFSELCAIATNVAYNLNSVPGSTKEQCGNVYSLMGREDGDYIIDYMSKFLDRAIHKSTFDEYPIIEPDSGIKSGVRVSVYVTKGGV